MLCEWSKLDKMSSYMSTEGSIDVESWLKANRLKKLVPYFLENEIEIEDLIQFCDDEQKFNQYCTETKQNQKLFLSNESAFLI